MKKLFLALILLWSSLAFAEIPKDFNVYTSSLSGGKAEVCRQLFSAYTEKYGGTALIQVHAGGEGTLAVNKLLTDTKFSVLCSGFADHIANPILLPKLADASRLSIVNIFAIAPINYLVSPTSNNTITTLIGSTKQLSIGYSLGSVRLVTQSVFNSILWVPYKKPSDAVPSLLDGSLDMYADSAQLSGVVASGILKNIGCLNCSTLSKYTSLDKVLPNASKILLFTGISVSDKYLSTSEELHLRINSILSSEKMRSIILHLDMSPIIWSLPNTTSYVEETSKKRFN